MRQRRAKIAYVYFDDFKVDTAHINQIINMLYVFAKNGETTLICPKISTPELNKRLKAVSLTRNFSIQKMQAKPRKGNIAWEFIARQAFSYQAIRYLRETQCDFVYTRDIFFLSLLSFLSPSLRPKCRIVFEAHRLYNKVFYSPLKQLPAWIEKRALRVTHCVVATTPGIKNDLINFHSIEGEKIRVEPNGRFSI